MQLLKHLQGKLLGRNGSQPRGKAGARAYVVGDIHGRLDLMNDLLTKIECDYRDRPSAQNYIVFLGDLIDRGPDSAGVVERLRTYAPSDAKVILLSGNHEEVLVRILKGHRGILPSWLKFGGTECAASYGIDVEELRSKGEDAAIKLVQSAIPLSHRKFIESFADTFRFGDYLFVHAGIRPGVPLEDQSLADLRWIREPFLSETVNHGFTIVHGHTIVEAVEERVNRIGIDTGAYKSGVLTGLGIEGPDRWLLTGRAAYIERGRSNARFEATC